MFSYGRDILGIRFESEDFHNAEVIEEVGTYSNHVKEYRMFKIWNEARKCSQWCVNENPYRVLEHGYYFCVTRPVVGFITEQEAFNAFVRELEKMSNGMWITDVWYHIDEETSLMELGCTLEMIYNYVLEDRTFKAYDALRTVLHDKFREYKKIGMSELLIKDRADKDIIISKGE